MNQSNGSRKWKKIIEWKTVTLKQIRWQNILEVNFNDLVRNSSNLHFLEFCCWPRICQLLRNDWRSPDSRQKIPRIRRRFDHGRRIILRRHDKFLWKRLWNGRIFCQLSYDRSVRKYSTLHERKCFVRKIFSQGHHNVSGKKHF